MMRLVLLVLHVSFSDPLNHLNLRGNNTGVSGAATLSLSQSLSGNATLTSYPNLPDNKIGDSVAARCRRRKSQFNHLRKRNEI